MKTNRTITLITLLAAALFLFLGGCESDPTGPDNPSAPTLPNPEQLQVDLSFFDQAEQTAKTGEKIGDNFINAYWRVAVINLMLRYYLTPPVAAFALALHTVPSHQEDNSWIWVYTYVQGEDELQIRLRGEQVGDKVAWELRVNAPSAQPAIENELWFAGDTRNDGRFGSWTFYDFTLEDRPAVSTISWGESLMGNFLTISALHGENAGDVLTYTRQGPENTITFYDASEDLEGYIRWHELSGTGSLMVPDYNGGQPACWDGNQNDIACDL